MNIQGYIRASKSKFISARSKVRAYEQKRMEQKLEALKQRRAYVESKADILRAHKREQAKIDAAEKINKEMSPLGRLQRKLGSVEKRLSNKENVERLATGTSQDNIFSLGKPNLQPSKKRIIHGFGSSNRPKW